MKKYVLTNIDGMSAVVLTNEEMELIYDALEEIKYLAWQYEELANTIQNKLHDLEKVK